MLYDLAVDDVLDYLAGDSCREHRRLSMAVITSAGGHSQVKRLW